jgi:hypothetical protein
VLRFLLQLLPWALGTGLFDPCYDYWAEMTEKGAATTRMTIPMRVDAVEYTSKGEELTCSGDCSTAEWSRVIGKRVRFVYRDHVHYEGEEVPVNTAGWTNTQMVLRPEVFDPEVRQAFDLLRTDSKENKRETGLWVFVTADGKRHFSRAMTSGDSGHIGPGAINAAFEQLADQMKREKGSKVIREISFVHTHPTATPLSQPDMEFMRNVEKLYPTVRLRCVALPVTRPDLVFLKTFNYR